MVRTHIERKELESRPRLTVAPGNGLERGSPCADDGCVGTGPVSGHMVHSNWAYRSYVNVRVVCVGRAGKRIQGAGQVNVKGHVSR